MSQFVNQYGAWSVLMPSGYRDHPIRLTNEWTVDVREAIYDGETSHEMSPDEKNPPRCRLCNWGTESHIRQPITHVACETCWSFFPRDEIDLRHVEVLLPSETFETPSGPFKLHAHWTARTMFFCGVTCMENRLRMLPLDLTFRTC